MPAELIRTATADGMLLDGLFAAPDRPAAPSRLSLDACLLLHGTGGNFYSPGVLEATARESLASGLSTLRVNTRGHDGICSVPSRSGSIRGGAAYEKVSDCVHDVSAWLDWLASRGLRRVVLVGHSMGGVKAVYSQAHAPHAAVAAVVGLSPPRFCHERFQQHPSSARFRADFRKAQELAGDHAGETLLHATQPIPVVVTANGFLEKYGPEDRYDFVPLLARLRCPTLIVMGTETEKQAPAFDQTLDAIACWNPALSHVTTIRVPGAEINYLRQPEEPFRLLADWWRRLPHPTRAD